MPDVMTPEQRSERMSRVRDKDTKPEKVVRSVLHRMGYRFRLHVKNLPGKPDIMLPRYRKVIFVHGCFWHRHGVCRRLSIPENNPDFWRRKFRDNVRRDKNKLKSLRALGWDVLVIWECETKDRDQLRQTLQAFMTKKP
jgi:DNA mismatch endonuclease (patch repair protein)